MEKASKFLSQIHRVLQLHEATALDEFRVRLDFNISPMMVNAWIYYAFAKRVQRLELNFAKFLEYKQGLPLRSSACEDWFSAMSKGSVELLKTILICGLTSAP
ncbi:OLC1v1039245C1 [Oldenlandia corymbosa var. corymbosa]|uniref:OLC1v1039245C1 n=1 Tax=Oldenlandia corymbosa var. corymbosa TaxID=529605 RepID=A0AAV1D4A0_OLDCO|nr:OLC1v1039245C1 [Oldenlandia corymbosa var. corymbosa]